MKRWIILLHRYLGIPMSFVFVVWFISGIVMMYTGDMPSLSAEEKYLGQGPLDLAAVELTPAEAAARGGLQGNPRAVTMQSLFGRPLYRFSGAFGGATRVFADTGEVFAGATPEQARIEVARFLNAPVSAVQFVGTVTEPDQWTIAQVRNLPLERFDVGNGGATRAYFSLEQGEVMLVTDGSARLLAWLGAIPHWFYFSALRSNQAAWSRTVVWTAAVGCVMAVLGLILAFTQFRRSRPFRLSASIRYRGLMRWHYYTGALFGLFALTWVFSGLLSMEPFAWTNATGMRLPPNRLESDALGLDRYRFDAAEMASALAGSEPYAIELLGIDDSPYFAISGLSASDRRIVDAQSLRARQEPFSAEAIIAELESTVTEAAIRDHAVLDDYDAYYYARGDALPLPVLRVRFDDPAETWYYFDLNTRSPIFANHRLSRLERWLFNGLHSLDFGFWYDRRPFWDIGMILLSLGALATSGIGLYLGCKRLLRRPARNYGA